MVSHRFTAALIVQTQIDVRRHLHFQPETTIVIPLSHVVFLTNFRVYELRLLPRRFSFCSGRKAFVTCYPRGPALGLVVTSHDCNIVATTTAISVITNECSGQTQGHAANGKQVPVEIPPP